MIYITVDSFKDKDSLLTYEFPQGSSVLDLKAEIEATEGIPVCCQRLLYNREALADNKELSSITKTVFLVKNLVSVRLEPWGTWGSTSRVITVPLDLNGPIQQLFEDPRIKGTADPSKSAMYLYDPDKIPVPIDDTSKSFMSYNIHPLDTILLRFEALGVYLDPASHTPVEVISEAVPLGRSVEIIVQSPAQSGKSWNWPAQWAAPSISAEAGGKVRAKYDWDGDLNHPYVTGLPLKRGAILLSKPMHGLRLRPGPGWLYGSLDHKAISQEPKPTLWEQWSGRENRCYFPENYVCPIDDSGEANNDRLEAEPELPIFCFPALKGEAFKVNLGDGGHSFIDLSVQYERSSRPSDPSEIIVKLNFSTHGARRVSAFSAFIKIRNNIVSDVRTLENEAHKVELAADVQVTTSQSTQAHFDGIQVKAASAQVEINGGVSKTSGVDKVETGHIADKRTVETRITKEGLCQSVYWNLKAPQIGFDTKGLCGEESISFTLARKPVRFWYNCAVTYELDGKKKKLIKRTKRY